MTASRKNSRAKHPGTGEWKVLQGVDRIRWTRVQAAQARIASGYYDRDEVQAAVAAAVLRDLKRH